MSRIVKAALTLTYVVLVTNCAEAGAVPVIFWASQPASPGDVVMAYGGDLGGVHSVEISRLADLMTEPSATPAIATRAVVPVFQASDHSIKFILPKWLKPGVFAIRYGGNSARLIDAPEVNWCQSARLLPGLNQNEAAPGSSIQIIGRNFVPAQEPGVVRVLVRDSRGHRYQIGVTQVEKYSLVVSLPRALPLGIYKIFVHNGYGGPAAWSEGQMLTVKRAAVWPAAILNIMDFGALGDNAHDDSAPMRRALATARHNGGGIVYFPAGIYRLNGWFEIPHRTVLRGEARELVWLKWPLIEPASTAEIIPSVLYASGEFAIENLSLMVRNAQTVLRDLSWDAATSGRAPLPQLQAELAAPGRERDIFVRNVDFQLLYYSGWHLHPEVSAQWKLNGLGWKNNELVKIVAIDGVHNLEISDSRFVGGSERILDSTNARLERNEFNNQWATLSWLDLGGEYIVLENNSIAGASSWRDNLLPVRYLYCAFNHSTNLVAGGREALTFDVNRLFPRTHQSAMSLATSGPWQGRARLATADSVHLQDTNLPLHAYRGLDLLVLEGRGAGQHRTISDSGTDVFSVEPAWDVIPDSTSILLAYRLSGDCILYRNKAEDTSVLLEIWGYLFDVTLDSNEVTRTWGMWALSGWFVQWLNNRLDIAVTLNPGLGPGGSSPQELTPERNAPYGLLGFAVGGRISQLPVHFPYVRGSVIRANHLSYGHRVLIRFGYDHRAVQHNPPAIVDVIIDANQIDHSAVGIEIDDGAAGVLLARNSFSHVTERTRLDPTPYSFIRQ
jgi:Pectate lyase superfamily protein